ncbi:retrotransposon protein, putative, ty1-copia subclass [Tanacetum coccineum]|uniref:Retrotransposon protein, putative, ty1-copia subclass n=1 Tax=Tanacetum coccineum TaxID=301880 RepID=A0ABQ5DC30_9ASTR
MKYGMASPKLLRLKSLGCEALVKRNTLTKPDKLDPRSFRCIFVGYPKETMGYSFYNSSENKVFVARNAEFFENNLIESKASGRNDEPQSDINPIRKVHRYAHALLELLNQEMAYAGELEMQSMKDNDVWVLVELPPNARTVGSKWLSRKILDWMCKPRTMTIDMQWMPKPPSSMDIVPKNLLEQPEVADGIMCSYLNGCAVELEKYKNKTKYFATSSTDVIDISLLCDASKSCMDS